MQKRLLIIDGNDQPCVKSLFLAFKNWEVFFFRPYALTYFIQATNLPLRQAFRWRQISEQAREVYIPVAGFTRFPDFSLHMLRKMKVRTSRRFGPSDVVVYTMPYYASLLEDDDTLCRIYLAYDPYRFYMGWNKHRVEQLEERILKAADAVCVISRQMELDWQMKTRGLLVHLPNATSVRFIEEFTTGRKKPPDDLASLPKPIVGCVGNIDSSYDWPLIRELAASHPKVSFVFIGNVTERHPERNAEIRQVLSLQNVNALGWKPHEEIPRYLLHFDICFNPLALNEMNHRRCPLKLYDYLVTDKPVLSTAIREAWELRPYINIGRSVEECSALLAGMLSGAISVDVRARHNFIVQQTWDQRAAQFAGILEQLAVKEA